MRYWVLGFVVATGAAAVTAFGNTAGEASTMFPLATLQILCVVVFAAGIVRQTIPAPAHGAIQSPMGSS